MKFKVTHINGHPQVSFNFVRALDVGDVVCLVVTIVDAEGDEHTVSVAGARPEVDAIESFMRAFNLETDRSDNT